MIVRDVTSKSCGEVDDLRQQAQSFGVLDPNIWQHIACQYTKRDPVVRALDISESLNTTNVYPRNRVNSSTRRLHPTNLEA